MKEHQNTQNEKEDLLREGRVDEPLKVQQEKKQVNSQPNSIEAKAAAEQEYKEALTERD